MFKQIVLISSIALVSACGGGGSDTPVAVVKPFEASVSDVSTSLNESATGTFTISTSNATGVVSGSMTLADASSDASIITLTKVSETSYSFALADIDRDRTVTINWTAQDGTDITRQKSGSFSFTIVNSSFTEPLARIQAFTANFERMVSLDEEKTLLSALRDITKVLGKDTVQFAASAGQNQGVSAFTSAFETMSHNLTAYLNEQNNDTALQAQFAETLAQFNNYAAPYKRELNAYLTMLAEEGKTPLTAGDFYINAELGSVSLFVGNAALGVVQDNEWLFNDDVAYIGSLIANTGCALQDE